MVTRNRLLRKIACILLPVLLVILFWNWLISIRSLNLKPAVGLQLSQLIAKLTEKQSESVNATLKKPSSLNPYFTKDAATREKSQTHKTSLITKKTCEQDFFLLILVCSAPLNVQRRIDIRHTWGVDSALKPRWKTVFLVAQTQNQSMSHSLLKEDEAFGDLIRANFYDDYWKLTTKIQMGFEWATRYCKFSFLIKIDDDVFVETRGLISLLNDRNTPQKKLYMGRLYKNPPVIRSGKWRVTLEEYNRTNYPNFCPGFGYVLSADVVDLFVDLFDVAPKFRLDDVYVGMLANRANVKVVNNEGFIVGPKRVTNCVFQNNTFVWHGIFGECLFEVYKQTFSRNRI